MNSRINRIINLVLGIRYSPRNIEILRLEIVELEKKISNMSVMNQKLSREVVQSKQITFAQSIIFQTMKHFLEKSELRILQKRIGSSFDGGYILGSQISKNAIVIGLGVGTNVDFELEICEVVKQVYIFDHTVDKPTGLPDNIEFIKKKVVANPLSESEISLSDILTKYTIADEQAENSEIIVKMDIEGYEWEVLRSLENSELQKIDQLVVEYHGFSDFMYLDSDYESKLDLLRRISLYFHITNLHGNNYAGFENFGNSNIPDVLEVSYINKDKIKNQILSSKNEKLNFPNNPNLPEIENLYWQT